MAKKIENTMAAEEMVTVTTAALEVATKCEIETARAAQNEVTARQNDLAASYSRLKAFFAHKNINKTEAQKIRWLENAKLTVDGKYLIVVEDDYAGYAEHPTWKPCFYIVKNNYTLTRIGLKFVYELIKNGTVKEMTKTQVAAALKTSKVKVTKANKTEKLAA